MDQMFFSPPNGVPSESKLATYMSRQNVTTPPYGLNKLTLDSPLTIKKTQVTPQSPNFHWPYTSPSSNGGAINGNGTNSTSSNSSTNNGHIVKPNLINPIKGGRSLIMRDDSPQSLNDSPRLTPQPSPPPLSQPVLQENVGGTTYFYPALNPNSGSNSNGTENPYASQTPASLPATSSDVYSVPGHVYPGPASSVINLQQKSKLHSAFFMPDEMRLDIQTRNAIANSVEAAAASENLELPLEVDSYHSLAPLESLPISMKLSVQATMYKATHSTTGIKYCLRRIHGFRIQSTKCMSIIDSWKKLQHSNLIQLREVFTTKAFGDNSLILVYDYHPGSQTLLSKYFTPTTDSNGYSDPFSGDARPFSHKSSMMRTMNGPMLPENEIWFLIMQITAGLRAIHQSGLACRTLDPTKIIITGKRVRFSCLSISDIVSFDPNQTNQLAVTTHFQQEDLTSLGKLVLALACRSLLAIHHDQIQASIELVARHYSNDLRNLILYLLATSRRTLSDLMPMIGARFYTQLDALQTQCDMQEDELAKEMENGRLYRLLVKLGCINERPEFNLDASWAETGDRYMLKLFRDYLFHSVTEEGRPWLDHAHIVQCLNKLDAGTMEKVQLMSRDEQSILVVTYAELKHCLEQSFAELVAATA